MRDKVHSIEKEQQFYRAVLVWAVPLLVAAAVAVTSWLLRDPPKDTQVQAEVTVAPTGVSQAHTDASAFDSASAFQDQILGNTDRARH